MSFIFTKILFLFQNDRHWNWGKGGKINSKYILYEKYLTKKREENTGNAAKGLRGVGGSRKKSVKYPS